MDEGRFDWVKGRARHWTGRLGIRLGLERFGAQTSTAASLPDPYLRVYFHHIRKTGGTSLVRSFLGLGGEDPVAVEHRMAQSLYGRTQSGGMVFVSGHREIINSGQYMFAFSHNPAHRVALPDKTFTVTVVRDPVSRALSYYTYLRQGDSTDAAFRVRERERRIARNGFEAFLDSVPKEHLLRQLYTFSSSFNVAEAVDAINRCSAVIDCAQLDVGVQALAARLQLPLTARRDRVTASAKETLPQPVMDRLRQSLQPEYDFLAQVENVTKSSSD